GKPWAQELEAHARAHLRRRHGPIHPVEAAVAVTVDAVDVEAHADCHSLHQDGTRDEGSGGCNDPKLCVEEHAEDREGEPTCRVCQLWVAKDLEARQIGEGVEL